MLIECSEMTVNCTVIHCNTLHYITLWNTLQQTAVQATKQNPNITNVTVKKTLEEASLRLHGDTANP